MNMINFFGENYMYVFLVVLFFSSAAQAITITKQHAQEVGKKIWKNECGGTVSGLTSWNEGEEFASLGICHFIWCPAGKPCPFAQTFPALLSYFEAMGKKVPRWIDQKNRACPWKSRSAFLKQSDSSRMNELRTLLLDTVDLQIAFAIQRLEESLPKMLKTVAKKNQEHIKTQFRRLEKSSSGIYALIDYNNFKGDGTAVKERYNGHGWGLLQVLENMKGTDPKTAPKEFAEVAKKLLARRVENAPSQRNEIRWLPGWKNRLDTYTR
jgi:hypothetical protein